MKFTSSYKFFTKGDVKAVNLTLACEAPSDLGPSSSSPRDLGPHCSTSRSWGHPHPLFNATPTPWEPQEGCGRRSSVHARKKGMDLSLRCTHPILKIRSLGWGEAEKSWLINSIPLLHSLCAVIYRNQVSLRHTLPSSRETRRRHQRPSGFLSRSRPAWRPRWRRGGGAGPCWPACSPQACS